MINPYTEDEHFEGVNYTETPLAKGEYENCTFRNCNFGGSELAEIIFSQCKFESCDFSMA